MPVNKNKLNVNLRVAQDESINIPAAVHKFAQANCNYCAATLSGGAPICPICFSTEQERYLWSFITRQRLVRSGEYVLHYMPSPWVAARFSAVLGSYYHACAPADVDQTLYPTPLYMMDPVDDVEKLAPNFYSLIIAINNLSTLKQMVMPVLRGFEKALIVGGSMVFGGDFIGADGLFVDEQMQSDRPGNNRRSPYAILRSGFGSDCRTRSSGSVSRTELARIGVNQQDVDRISTSTLFWHQV
jgi:hypothetical protein